jgi:hypothetical protein
LQTGRPLLYRDVTILDSLSLDALWWTFHNNPDIGQLVRGLSFMFCVKKSLFREEKSCQDMAEILALCPRVARVDFLPPFYPAYGSDPSDIFPTIPSSVTSLSIGSHIHLKDLGSTLLRQSCKQLQELRIPLDAHAGEYLASLQFSFPHLHTLHLTCDGTFAKRAPWMLTFNWKMPQLRRVTFRTRDCDISRDPAGLVAIYSGFLRIHGRKLTFLQFPDCPEPRHEEENNYGKLLALCPALRHVVLPAWATMDDDHVFPSVRSLDLWGVRASEAVDMTHWPNVETVRRLDGGLKDVILDLPVALDPRVQWRKLAWPGVALLNLERKGVSNVLDVGRVKEDELRRLAVERRREIFPWDERAASSASSSDSESEGDEADADADGNGESNAEGEPDAADGEGEDNPQLGLRPTLRRLLQATMPERVFARFMQPSA